MINFNENEKEGKNEDLNNVDKKKNKNLMSNQDLDQICLDNINDLLY